MASDRSPFITLLEHEALGADFLKAAIEGEVDYDLSPLTILIVPDLP